VDQPIPGAFPHAVRADRRDHHDVPLAPWKRWIVPHMTSVFGSPAATRVVSSGCCWAASGVTTPIDALGYAARRRCTSATTATNSGWLAPEPLAPCMNAPSTCCHRTAGSAGAAGRVGSGRVGEAPPPRFQPLATQSRLGLLPRLLLHAR
jgi:hypothetical protein